MIRIRKNPEFILKIPDILVFLFFLSGMMARVMKPVVENHGFTGRGVKGHGRENTD
jgi:hypothetical protein